MKYRKKPVEVDAWRVDFSQPSPDWLSKAMRDGVVYYQGGEKPYLTMKSHDGVVHAYEGRDWIIRQSDTDIYPCGHETFVQIYEEV